MKIAVIGGGPTGMAEAIYLAQKGCQVTLYEKSGELGGLAGWFNIGGSDVERYYHFIMTCDKHYLDLLELVGVKEQINWVETKTSFFYENELHPFSEPIDILKFKPLNLYQRLRLAWTLGYMTKLAKNWKPFEDRMACEWLPKVSTQRAWDVIWKPMLDMKFGEHASEMSMAWLWARCNMVGQYRPEGKSAECRGWLKGSTRTFIEAAERVMAELGVTVRKGVSIERISVKDGRAEGVVIDNKLAPFDHIVYSAPSPFLKGMMPEETQQMPYFQQIYSQKCYGATCMVLALKKPFNPYFWTYVNDPRVPFVGVINYSDFTAWEGQEGRHVIYVPWYSETNVDPYTRDSDALIKDWAQGLKIVQPDFDESWIIEGVVGRAPYASMICSGRYSERLVPLRGPIKDFTFANLSQIYPQDRGISIGIKLSRYAVKSVLEDREVEMDFSPKVSAEPVDF